MKQYNLRRWRLRLLLSLVACLMSATSWAQMFEISGRVIDSESNPIIGATVVITAKNQGTATDTDGRYKLKVAKGDVLEYSALGYKSAAAVAGTKTVIDITLSTDALKLDEVVAIGYGTARRSDLTGAVSSISASNLLATGAQTLEQAMIGQAAGVTIESGDNSAGANSMIRIRGANSINGSSEPLYVINGIPIMNSSDSSNDMNSTSLSPIAGISPKDIESIDILKDASATAIYGAQGANGVIIINTKQGGGSMKVSASISGGVQVASSDVYDMMDAEQFTRYMDYTQFPYPLNNYLTEESLSNNKYSGYHRRVASGDFAETSDWLDEIMRTGSVANVNVGISGGGKDSQYNVNFGYYNNRGVITSTNLDRYSLNFNAQSSNKKRVQFGVNALMSYMINNGIITSTNSTVTSQAGILLQALLFNPSVPMVDENGNPIVDDPMSDNDQRTNPYLNAPDVDMTSYYTNFNVRGFMNVKIIDGLNFRLQGGGNLNNKNTENYFPTTTNIGRSSNGRSFNETNRSGTIIMEAMLNYNKSIRDHRFNAVAGTTLNQSMWKYNTLNNENFAIDGLGTNSLQSGTNPTVFSNSSKNNLLSYLARLQYSFGSKYSLTASFRADGTSKVAKDNRWGYFPSAAAAWRLSEENFLKGWDPLSNLKLRVGYGITGNQNIAAYQEYNTYAVSGAVVGGADEVGLVQSTISNPDLKWETTTAYNVGLDFGFFKNRLSGTVDLYLKKTNDLLLKAIVPSTTGVAGATMFQNLGSMENRGIEVSISSVNIEKRDFRWSTTFNIASNQNKVTDLGGSDMIQVAGSSAEMMAVLKVGEPIGLWYGWEGNGVWQQNDFSYKFSPVTSGAPKGNWVLNPVNGKLPAARTSDAPGSRKYVDQNGDGLINDDDRVIIARSQPKFTGSLNNNFRYKNFDLSFLMDFSYGKEVVHGTEWAITEQSTDIMNKLDNNPWMPTEYGIYESTPGQPSQINTNVINKLGNPSNTETYAAAGIQGTTLSDVYVEDGSYLRLKSLTVGYTLPVKSTAKMGISSARVYLSATNLFTITGYTGYDPAVNTSNLNGLRLGYDYSAYPLAKTFTVGIDLTF